MFEDRGLSHIDSERLEHIRRFTELASSFYIYPLYLLFLIADYLWYPAHLSSFTALRLIACILVFVSAKVASKQTSRFKIEAWTTLFVFNCVWPMQVMVYLIGDANTPYYAGLTLTAVGVSSGLRLSWPFYWLTFSLMMFPLMFVGFLLDGYNNSSFFLLNLLFFSSTTMIITVGRYFNEKLHEREFTTRSKLNEEIESRGKVISEKTNQALKLHSLSKQFSPQIISSLESGVLSLDRRTHRSELCVLFVDIVGSTEKFIRLDRDDLQKILSMYMEDVMGTFLKYDITIDKFLGDGVLGFSNDPIAQPDYIERVIKAALEIKAKISNKREEYSRYWLSEFEFSIGISTGFASVGFYGSDLHVKTYTAIGRVVNLASRLGTAAGPNEILISHEAVAKLRESASSLLSDLKLLDRGTPPLKGFETEKIRVFQINSEIMESANAQNGFFDEVCPNGHGVLYLAQENGIYHLKCRLCDYRPDENKKISSDAA